MARIRIVSTPQGTEPEEIRIQWVGVVMPLATPEDLVSKPITNLNINRKTDHIVLRTKAIRALRSAGRLNAANFWKRSPAGIYPESDLVSSHLLPLFS